MAQFTQREHLFLDDLLHMEEVQVTQCVDFAHHCSDPQLQQLCMDIARRDEQHFRALLTHLNQAQGKSQSQGNQSANAGFPAQAGAFGGGYQATGFSSNPGSSGSGFNQ